MKGITGNNKHSFHHHRLAKKLLWQLNFWKLYLYFDIYENSAEDYSFGQRARCCKYVKSRNIDTSPNHSNRLSTIFSCCLPLHLFPQIFPVVACSSFSLLINVQPENDVCLSIVFVISGLCTLASFKMFRLHTLDVQAIVSLLW